MKKILKISFSFFLIFCFSGKAQSLSTTDRLEKTIIDFIEKEKKCEYCINNSSIFVLTYSIPFNKYIVYLEGVHGKGKLCKEASSSIYKILTTKDERHLYIGNRFMPPIIINDDNAAFFYTTKECEELKDVIYTSIKVMLLIDSNFSVEKEIRGWDLESLTEDILCPELPVSKERSRMRKKYGKPI